MGRSCTTPLTTTPPRRARPFVTSTSTRGPGQPCTWRPGPWSRSSLRLRLSHSRRDVSAGPWLHRVDISVCSVESDDWSDEEILGTRDQPAGPWPRRYGSDHPHVCGKQCVVEGRGVWRWGHPRAGGEQVDLPPYVGMGAFRSTSTEPAITDGPGGRPPVRRRRRGHLVGRGGASRCESHPNPAYGMGRTEPGNSA